MIESLVDKKSGGQSCGNGRRLHKEEREGDRPETAVFVLGPTESSVESAQSVSVKKKGKKKGTVWFTARITGVMRELTCPPIL